MTQSRYLVYDYVTGDIIDPKTGLVVDRIYDQSIGFTTMKMIRKKKKRRVPLYKVWRPPKTLTKTIKYIHYIIVEMRLQELKEKAEHIAYRAYDILRSKKITVQSQILAAASVYLALLSEQGYVSKNTLYKIKTVTGIGKSSQLYDYIAILRRYFEITRTKKQLKKILRHALEKLSKPELYPRALELADRIPEQIIKNHKLNIVAAMILAQITSTIKPVARILETNGKQIQRVRRKLKYYQENIIE